LKRSEYIALGAVGLLAVATFWPSSEQKPPQEDAAIGKGDGFQTLAFASLDECKAAQIVTASTCDAEFGKAAQTSVADAPKFDTLASCEGEYGASACRPASWNGASVFVPALAGILIARSIANASAQSQPLYPPRTGPVSCPPGIGDRPECAQRSSASSSSSGSGSSGSGRRYYSTGTGRVVGRVAASVIADTFLPSRTSVNRSVITRTISTGPSAGSTTRSSGNFSSSPTTSRGGFGSTSRSYSSSGS
jgi:uncharacterized protein YgiB involved in biofilm formation